MTALRQVGGSLVAIAGLRDGAIVDRAAKWLATRPEAHWPRPLASELAKLFGLTPNQAEAAVREARLIRARAL